MYPTSLSFSLPVNPANPSHLAQSHFFRENGLTAFLSSIFVFLHQVASVKVFWLLTTWSRLYHFLKLALLLVHAFCISLSLSLSDINLLKANTLLDFLDFSVVLEDCALGSEVPFLETSVEWGGADQHVHTSGFLCKV